MLHSIRREKERISVYRRVPQVLSKIEFQQWPSFIRKEWNWPLSQRSILKRRRTASNPKLGATRGRLRRLLCLWILILLLRQGNHYIVVSIIIHFKCHGNLRCWNTSQEIGSLIAQIASTVTGRVNATARISLEVFDSLPHSQWGGRNVHHGRVTFAAMLRLYGVDNVAMP